jgi:hypothetical protein
VEKNQTQNGVLYILFDDKEMLKECLHSVRSLKKNSPGTHSQLITNIPLSRSQKSLFTFVDQVSDPIHPLKAKVKYLLKSRFQNTLFIDADTEIKGDLEEIFALSPQFDFAMTYDNLCDWDTDSVKFLAQESGDINTGLLFYRSIPAVTGLFEEWLEKIMPQDEVIMRPGTYGDQWYFNEFLRDRIKSGSLVKNKMLSNEVYNVRPWCWDKLKRENKFRHARILHAHHLHHGFFTKALRKIKAIARKLSRS